VQVSKPNDAVDESRKRVLAIVAGILAARKLAQFEGGKRVPATVSAIAVMRKNSLRRILARRNIDIALPTQTDLKFRLVNVADSKRIQEGQYFDEGQALNDSCGKNTQQENVSSPLEVRSLVSISSVTRMARRYRCPT
jgi:hypothetical protein